VLSIPKFHRDRAINEYVIHRESDVPIDSYLRRLKRFSIQQFSITFNFMALSCKAKCGFPTSKESLSLEGEGVEGGLGKS
jgi:hypothetical protein